MQTTSGKSAVFKSEMALWCGILTTAVFLMFGYDMLGDLSSSVRFLLLFGWLFAVMLWLSFGVVRHADCLAVILGEPYGTLILTLAVISIEVVMISAVMITGDNVPTLARDTMFAVLMIILNGLLGLTLLLGGLKHREQEYNMTGAKTYLGVIVPLAVLGLILPRFTTSAPGGQVTPLMAVFLLLMSGGLYVVFLLIQTRRHTQFFKQPSATVEDHSDDHHHEGLVIRSVGHHVLFLVLTMLPIVLLSKNMAKLVDHGIETLSAPQALGGFLVAILVLSPEGMAAIKSALSNQLQRTVNIGLGSALSTIGLTIPAVLVISLVTGRTVELGLEAAEIVLLILTLVVAAINFGTGRTNIMQGAVHLIIFLAYIVLIFD
ncbi:MAG: calcium:proton antiporter [Gammaproteobacteria bacterium]|nr:calcium:proton antiporter [Gammaproteobacteria bacterium]